MACSQPIDYIYSLTGNRYDRQFQFQNLFQPQVRFMVLFVYEISMWPQIETFRDVFTQFRTPPTLFFLHRVHPDTVRKKGWLDWGDIHDKKKKKNETEKNKLHGVSKAKTKKSRLTLWKAHGLKALYEKSWSPDSTEDKSQWKAHNELWQKKYVKITEKYRLSRFYLGYYPLDEIRKLIPKKCYFAFGWSPLP